MPEISVAELEAAVQRRHGGKAHCIQRIELRGDFGQWPEWDRLVHVFELSGVSGASGAYAWSTPPSNTAQRKFFCILHAHPIHSAAAAVRAAMREELRTGALGRA